MGGCAGLCDLCWLRMRKFILPRIYEPQAMESTIERDTSMFVFIWNDYFQIKTFKRRRASNISTGK